MMFSNSINLPVNDNVSFFFMEARNFKRDSVALQMRGSVALYRGKSSTC
jgi:hypothetical protein